ncbi:hypothetical protein A2U01_0040998 [Trifolium medium]|uniref:Uncharacterized protein n=1 Tax=Trifolium medium TaxID=97028 RepID=A0A392Q6S9_9FABA|nr:hypothetical protein [Trifolium medium]
MNVQEEIISISLSEEDLVEEQIETLEKDLRPLLKRKNDLRNKINKDIDKLFAKRRTLARYQENQKKLSEESIKLLEDLEVSKKCKLALEEMHASASEAAKDLLG